MQDNWYLILVESHLRAVQNSLSKHYQSLFDMMAVVQLRKPEPRRLRAGSLLAQTAEACLRAFNLRASVILDLDVFSLFSSGDTIHQGSKASCP